MKPASHCSPTIRTASAPGGQHDDAEDRRLVACVCAHELAAFETLYRRFQALKTRSRHDEPLPDASEDAEPQADAAERPEARMSLAQARAAIDKALRALSVDQRAAVELAHFHGFGYPDIAETWNARPIPSRHGSSTHASA